MVSIFWYGGFSTRTTIVILIPNIMDRTMKYISEYIAEATDDKRWVAIEVTTAADRYHKETTSQRVVTYDTYRK